MQCMPYKLKKFDLSPLFYPGSAPIRIKITYFIVDYFIVIVLRGEAIFLLRQKFISFTFHKK